MNDNIIATPINVVPPPQKRIWGGWATAGFGAVVLTAFFTVQTAVIIIALLINGIPNLLQLSTTGSMDTTQMINKLFPGNLGLVQSLATIISGIIGVWLIVVFVKLRGRAGVTEYLGLPKIKFKSVLLSVGIVVVYLALSAAVNIWTGKTESNQLMYDIYNTSVWLPLFWIAVVVFAPLFEEVMFRGFVFEGLRQSRIGAVWAIIIASLVWTLLHAFQYGLYELASVFIMGIVFGVVRLKTKSLWNAIIMHALVNLAATLELALNLDKYL